MHFDYWYHEPETYNPRRKVRAKRTAVIRGARQAEKTSSATKTDVDSNCWKRSQTCQHKPADAGCKNEEKKHINFAPLFDEPCPIWPCEVRAPVRAPWQDMKVTLTGHMKDGLETESKAPNFHRIFLLDTVAQQKDSFPVVARKYRIIVRVESRSLYCTR